MSLKVGYCVFYVAFIAILLFFSVEMGVDIITGITDAQLVVPEPPTGGGLFDSLTFLFNIAVFGVTTFGFLVILSTPFQVLFIFVIVPLTFGFLWSIIELARGN